jgi:hypothetical protein
MQVLEPSLYELVLQAQIDEVIKPLIDALEQLLTVVAQ